METECANAWPISSLGLERTSDALIDDLGNPAQWPRADVIIGNPPFLGAKFLKLDAAPITSTPFAARDPRFREWPTTACIGSWSARPSSALYARRSNCRPAAGLVGTQNIRNNQSRVGGLDYVVQTGTIVEAVDNQPVGVANVHVSIADWVKTQDHVLLPSKRRLWFRPGQLPQARHSRTRERGRPGRFYAGQTLRTPRNRTNV